MRKLSNPLIGTFLCFVVLFGAAGLWGQAIGAKTTYNITDLGVLPGGANSFSLWLTNSGEVVGYSEIGQTDSSGNPIVHAFRWRDGRMEDLGALGGSNTTGANDEGEAVGVADLTGGSASHGVLWHGHSPTDLSTLVGASGYSWAQQINDLGQIVGGSEAADGTFHAVCWHHGMIKDLGVFGPGLNSFASGINERGQIAGGSQVSDVTDPHLGFPPFYAVLWNDGMMMNLGPGPGGIGAAAASLNNHAQVVGRFAVADSVVGAVGHAFLWERGVMQDLGVPMHAQDSEALGLNDRGQIVGDSFMGFIESPSMAGRALLWETRERIQMPLDLNTRIDPGSGYFLISAAAINGRGQIVVSAMLKGSMSIHAALLTPEDRNSEDDTARAAGAETISSMAAPPLSENARRLLQLVRARKLGHSVKVQHARLFPGELIRWQVLNQCNIVTFSSPDRARLQFPVGGELLPESRFYRCCASELALAFGTHPLAVKRSDPRNAL